MYSWCLRAGGYMSCKGLSLALIWLSKISGYCATYPRCSSPLANESMNYFVNVSKKKKKKTLPILQC